VIVRVWCRSILVVIASIAVRRDVAAQSRAVEPELVLGLSLQPDAVKDHGRGGYNFTLFPIGPAAGGAVRWRFRGGSSLAARVDGAFFLVGEMDRTGFDDPVDKPESLALLTGGIEWRSSDRVSLPFSIGAGVTRAISAPRTGRETTPVVTLGLFRHLTKHSDARAGLSVATNPIGRSWFQLPIGVAIHPADSSP